MPSLGPVRHHNTVAGPALPPGIPVPSAVEPEGFVQVHISKVLFSSSVAFSIAESDFAVELTPWWGGGADDFVVVRDAQNSVSTTTTPRAGVIVTYPIYTNEDFFGHYVQDMLAAGEAPKVRVYVKGAGGVESVAEAPLPIEQYILNGSGGKSEKEKEKKTSRRAPSSNHMVSLFRAPRSLDTSTSSERPLAKLQITMKQSFTPQREEHEDHQHRNEENSAKAAPPPPSASKQSMNAGVVHVPPPMTTTQPDGTRPPQAASSSHRFDPYSAGPVSTPPPYPTTTATPTLSTTVAMSSKERQRQLDALYNRGLQLQAQLGLDTPQQQQHSEPVASLPAPIYLPSLLLPRDIRSNEPIAAPSSVVPQYQPIDVVVSDDSDCSDRNHHRRSRQRQSQAKQQQRHRNSPPRDATVHHFHGRWQLTLDLLEVWMMRDHDAFRDVCADATFRFYVRFSKDVAVSTAPGDSHIDITGLSPSGHTTLPNARNYATVVSTYTSSSTIVLECWALRHGTAQGRDVFVGLVPCSLASCVSTKRVRELKLRNPTTNSEGMCSVVVRMGLADAEHSDRHQKEKKDEDEEYRKRKQKEKEVDAQRRQQDEANNRKKPWWEDMPPPWALFPQAWAPPQQQQMQQNMSRDDPHASSSSQGVVISPNMISEDKVTRVEIVRTPLKPKPNTTTNSVVTTATPKTEPEKVKTQEADVSHTVPPHNNHNKNRTNNTSPALVHIHVDRICNLPMVACRSNPNNVVEPSVMLRCHFPLQLPLATHTVDSATTCDPSCNPHCDVTLSASPNAEASTKFDRPLLKGAVARVEVLHNPSDSNGRGPLRLGCAYVDLTALRYAHLVPELDGWYHIRLQDRTDVEEDPEAESIGQIKLRCSVTM